REDGRGPAGPQPMRQRRRAPIFRAGLGPCGQISDDHLPLEERREAGRTALSLRRSAVDGLDETRRQGGSGGVLEALPRAVEQHHGAVARGLDLLEEAAERVEEV